MRFNVPSERFGAILGRLGAVLAPSWRRPGPSWRHLGSSWSRRGLAQASPGAQKTLKFLGFFNIFLNLDMFASFAVLEAFERVLRASWSHF